MLKKIINAKTLFIFFLLLEIITFFVYRIFVYASDSLTLLQTVIPWFLGNISFIALGIVFHELGHFVIGKIKKFKLSKISFLGFNISKNNNNYKITYSFSQDYAGLCEMYPDGLENMKSRFCWLAFGGIIGHLFIIIVNVLLFAFINQPFYKFLCMGFLTNMYFLFINALPWIRSTNDGSLIYNVLSETDLGNTYLDILRINALLYSGKSPSEIDDEYLNYSNCDSEYSSIIAYFKYLKALDSEDKQEIENQINELIKNVDKFSYTSYYEVISEILYYGVISKNQELVKKFEKDACVYLESENSPTNLRILSAYRYYLGDDMVAELTRNSGLKLVDYFYIKGIAIMEKKLLKKSVYYSEHSDVVVKPLKEVIEEQAKLEIENKI